jgi:hypothetical protein
VTAIVGSGETMNRSVVWMVVVGCVVLTFWSAGSTAGAHPHPGDVVTDTIRGRVTEVNLERRTIAIDALDKKTKKLRNYFAVVDPKVKVTRAKKKVALTELTVGQPVICAVEIELDQNGRETRLIAFDIQFDLTARPAVY